MKNRDKLFIFGTVIFSIFLAIVVVFTDTPIQKAAKEYVRQGDLTVYEYR